MKTLGEKLLGALEARGPVEDDRECRCCGAPIDGDIGVVCPLCKWEHDDPLEDEESGFSPANGMALVEAIWSVWAFIDGNDPGRVMLGTARQMRGLAAEGGAPMAVELSRLLPDGTFDAGKPVAGLGRYWPVEDAPAHWGREVF